MSAAAAAAAGVRGLMISLIMLNSAQKTIEQVPAAVGLAGAGC